MRKNAQHNEKWSQHVLRVRMSGGLRVPSSRRGEALPQKNYERDYETIVQHAEGEDPRALRRSAELRETARGSRHRQTLVEVQSGFNKNMVFS